MQLFENVNCDLCGSAEHQTIYQSKQYADSSLGKLNIDLVICDNCNFIFQNPQLTSQALTEHYQKSSSGNVFRLNNHGSIHHIFHQEVLHMIDSFISMEQINSICDVGGGRGQVLSEIKASDNVKKYLIEPSEAIHKCADKNVIKINSKIESVDKNTLPPIDFLMCTATLEHLKQPTEVLKTFSELLSNDGYLFIEVPNSLHPYNTFAEFYSYEHINHFTVKTILSLLDKTGFYPVKMEESRHHPSLKIIAQKYQKNNYFEQCTSLFKRYHSQKESSTQLLESKIDQLIYNGKISHLGIYGAGDHTRFLLEKSNLLPSVKYFIDSDPAKWGKFFYNIEIIPPGEIEEKQLTDVLISSHDFEYEIEQTIKHHCSKSINIIKLYS